MECLAEYAEKLALASNCFHSYQQQNCAPGIGQLAEHSLHGILKFYFDPDASHHEAQLPEGPIADIFDGEKIIEIQTGNYAALAKKIPRILLHYPVQVVCPIVRDRYLYRLNPNDGSVSGGRKSPLHGNRAWSLVALASLDPFIDNSGFAVTFLLIDTAEYRAVPVSGKKRGEKVDRVPCNIADVWTVSSREDYQTLIPEGLPTVFTASEFAKTARLRGRNAFYALKLLRTRGIVSQIGKEGRANIYKLNE